MAQVVLLSGCGFGAGIAVGVWLLRRLSVRCG